MKVFQVCGFHQTGKTTTVSALIQRFKASGNMVASLKDIHFEGFQLEQPNKNTYVHRQAGADLVVARGKQETDFMYSRQFSLPEIASLITADWLVVEGMNHFPLPKIVCGKTEAEVDRFLDRRTFAIAGIIGERLTDYRGLRVFNPLNAESANELWALATRVVFPMLPYVEDDCCRLCGLTCRELVEAIVQGEKSYHDCTINETNVHLKIGGIQIPIVPFVQRVLKNNVLAVVNELKGWQAGKPIEVLIDR
ncbi:MAG: molybdopterin-guanine dinucleotide biosynthesis protein B [candidate division KSB1 bacterium]|nr:molybdopterin-guanine dinucleotide biosynthesis protein B [candidate division KSB1 bacterium]